MTLFSSGGTTVPGELKIGLVSRSLEGVVVRSNLCAAISLLVLCRLFNNVSSRVCRSCESLIDVVYVPRTFTRRFSRQYQVEKIVCGLPILGAHSPSSIPPPLSQAAVYFSPS